MSEKTTDAQVESANKIDVETDVETVETTPEAAVVDNTTCAERLAAIYGGLRGVRDDFADIVGLFRSVQQFDKNLTEVIKWHLPPEINKLSFEDDGVCDTSLTDEGYATWLANAIKGKNNVVRMNTLAHLARMLREGIKDLGRKDAKLTERINLQGAKSPEGHAAVVLRGKVRAGVQVLECRLADVCDKFYVTRKRMMVEVAKLTKFIAASTVIDDGRDKGKYPTMVVEKLRRNSVAGELSDIQKADGQMETMTNAKYRYNPNII